MTELPFAAVQPPPSNLPEMTVSELSQALKRNIEQNFSYVRVRGEISGFKRPSSGHCYLSLKDDESALDAVIWRSTASRIQLELADGMEVLCTGRLTTFASRSRYQLVIESIALAGAGALLKLLEDRRKRLAGEGLFEASRKKKLPYLPEVIGVVTSPSGAVIRDILHRLSDRFPRRVLLWPVPVQGEFAAREVAAAIAGFNALASGGAVPRPDLLIVARGGGSLEDLMAFNEEVVVRAAAASAIPLISAVGHETDTTLIDFAADFRAPTPSAAAEIAVPVRLGLIAANEALGGRLAGGIGRRLGQEKLHVEGLGRGLPDPAALINAGQQRLDDRTERLVLGINQCLRHTQQAIAMLAQRVNVGLLRAEIARSRERVDDLAPRLRTAAERQIARDRNRADHVAGRLLTAYQALRKPLLRGYAIVRDDKGRLVTDAARVKADAGLSLEFHDGKVHVVVPTRQGKLF